MTDPDLPHLIASAVADAIADVMPPSTTPANLARFESIGAALRRGWDSAAADKQPAPIYADPRKTLDVPLTTPPAGTATEIKLPRPGSGYATEIALRARIAELEAQIARLRVEPRSVYDDCLSDDGTTYEIAPARHADEIGIRLAHKDLDLAAAVRRADMLAALGLRSDL